jgi:tetratricopeptide (TPR) repeat protein
MTKNSLIILIVAVLTSFVAGFIVANSFNRQELNKISGEFEKLKNERKENTELELSIDEIKQKIAEADKNPENLEFQKTLGIALYKYANIKQDTTLFDDISRLLIRANNSKSMDFELLVTLGNLFSDKALTKTDNESFDKSRKYYEEALKLKPNDVEILCNIATTYLFQNPNNVEKAIVEFKKAADINQNFEPAIEGLIQAYLIQNKLEDAEIYLSKLKIVNSKNAGIKDFETQIAKLKTK